MCKDYLQYRLIKTTPTSEIKRTITIQEERSKFHVLVGEILSDWTEGKKRSVTRTLHWSDSVNEFVDFSEAQGRAGDLRNASLEQGFDLE